MAAPRFHPIYGATIPRGEVRDNGEAHAAQTQRARCPAPIASLKRKVRLPLSSAGVDDNLGLSWIFRRGLSITIRSVWYDGTVRAQSYDWLQFQGPTTGAIVEIRQAKEETK